LSICSYLLVLAGSAEAQTFVGAEISGGMAFSTNAGLQTTSTTLTSGAPDRVLIASMRSGHVSISHQRKRFWAETGFGLYSTQESHKAGNNFIFGRYKNIQIPLTYWYVPLKAGWDITTSKRLITSVY